MHFLFLSADFSYFTAGDNSTPSKANSSSTENANTSTEDSNASASVGNTTTTSSEGAVKFVEAPLPKVNAWKVSIVYRIFDFDFDVYFRILQKLHSNTLHFCPIIRVQFCLIFYATFSIFTLNFQFGKDILLHSTLIPIETFWFFLLPNGVWSVCV